MKFDVDMQANASAVITVELSNERLSEIAVDLEKTIGELTIDDLREYVEDEAYQQGVPGICAQCSGWGRSYSLEIGDEWTIPEDDDNTAEKFRAVRIKED